MEQLIGLIVFGLIYGVMWFINNVTGKAQEKQKQEAAERQKKLAAAKQKLAQEADQKRQLDEDGRTVVVAEPRRKKYRQVEQFRKQTDPSQQILVAAETVSVVALKRESVFDSSYDGTPFDDSTDRATDVAPVAESLSYQDNPIAENIMAMMSSPESIQQVVVLSEIFNRPKYD